MPSLKTVFARRHAADLIQRSLAAMTRLAAVAKSAPLRLAGLSGLAGLAAAAALTLGSASASSPFESCAPAGGAYSPGSQVPLDCLLAPAWTSRWAYFVISLYDGAGEEHHEPRVAVHQTAGVYGQRASAVLTIPRWTPSGPATIYASLWLDGNTPIGHTGIPIWIATTGPPPTIGPIVSLKDCHLLPSGPYHPGDEARAIYSVYASSPTEISGAFSLYDAAGQELHDRADRVYVVAGDSSFSRRVTIPHHASDGPATAYCGIWSLDSDSLGFTELPVSIRSADPPPVAQVSQSNAAIRHGATSTTSPSKQAVCHNEYQRRCENLPTDWIPWVGDEVRDGLCWTTQHLVCTVGGEVVGGAEFAWNAATALGNTLVSCIGEQYSLDDWSWFRARVDTTTGFLIGEFDESNRPCSSVGEILSGFLLIGDLRALAHCVWVNLSDPNDECGIGEFALNGIALIPFLGDSIKLIDTGHDISKATKRAAEEAADRQRATAKTADATTHPSKTLSTAAQHERRVYEFLSELVAETPLLREIDGLEEALIANPDAWTDLKRVVDEAVDQDFSSVAHWRQLKYVGASHRRGQRVTELLENSEKVYPTGLKTPKGNWEYSVHDGLFRRNGEVIWGEVRSSYFIYGRSDWQKKINAALNAGADCLQLAVDIISSGGDWENKLASLQDLTASQGLRFDAFDLLTGDQLVGTKPC